MEPVRAAHLGVNQRRRTTGSRSPAAGRTRDDYASHGAPLEPGRELRWIGHLGTRGIFDGEHRFRIEPMGSDRVRFVQEERFSGVLAPLIMRFIRDSTMQGFAEMNAALKTRAEGAMPADA